MGARKLKNKALSATAAQTLALLYGCEFASSLGLERIVVEFNSKENISCLVNDLSYGSQEAFPTWTKILLLRDSFQTCHWSWVPRSANMLADHLAPSYNAEMCGSTWINCNFVLVVEGATPLHDTFALGATSFAFVPSFIALCMYFPWFLSPCRPPCTFGSCPGYAYFQFSPPPKKKNMPISYPTILSTILTLILWDMKNSFFIFYFFYIYINKGYYLLRG